MEKFNFPTFPATDLVNFIRQNVLTGAEAKNLTKNDIYPNPKTEVVQRIYIRVLQEVFNYSMEQFSMVQMVDTEYPQLLEGFAPIANLIKLMGRFMPMARVYDFHPSDVLQPKGKRTLHLLSAIVNFLQFRNHQKEIYSGFCSSYKVALENIHQLQKANQEAESKIEKLTTVPPEQQAEFKALSSEIQDRQQTIQEYRAKDVVIQEKIAQKKADFAEKNKKMNQLKLEIATMKEEQERMKSQIVESPEQRKSKMERMKETVHKLKQSKQETSEKCDYYRDKVTLANQWQTDLQGYCKKLQNIEANVETHRKILEEIKEREDQVVNGNTSLKSLSNELSQLKRAILMKKEKLTKLDIKIKKKQEEFEQQKQEILESCSHIQEKRQAVHGRVASINMEIQQTIYKKDQLLEACEANRKKCQEIISDLRVTAEKYHDSLLKASERSAQRRKEKVTELERRLIRS